MLIESCPLITWERQPPNFSLNSRTKSNPRTVQGLGLQPQNVLVFGGLQHAPDDKGF